MRVKSCHLGVTLVELMVALFIASMLMIGVMQVVLATQTNYHWQRQMSGMQENARFALRELNTLMFNHGSLLLPCSGSASLANTTWHQQEKYASNIDFYQRFHASFPFKINADELNINERYLKKADPDSHFIMFNHIDQHQGQSVNNHDAKNATFYTSPHQISAGQAILAADEYCQQLALFYVTGPLTNMPLGKGAMSNKLEHHALAASSKLPQVNCSRWLFGQFDCNDASLPLDRVKQRQFNKNSVLYPIKARSYYVAGSTQKDQHNRAYPALYRDAQELVQGVERIQVLYGVDDNADGIANQYVVSDNMHLANWRQVKLIRLVLTMRSLEPVQRQSLMQGGDQSDDGYIRKQFMSTVAINNQ